jgi:transposase
MKAYSLDFRKKILDTYHNTPISQRQLAQKFNVALSFITKLLKQWRETGKLESKPLPGRPKKLTSDQEQVLLEILAEHFWIGL